MKLKALYATFLVMLLPVVAQASSGRILYVNGHVTVERSGKLYRAVRNAKLIEGDTLNTGKTGRMHVRMADRTLFSLKPNTSFTIETFKFSGETPAKAAAAPSSTRTTASTDRSLFRLVKGGFRAITGLIGKRNRSAFGVNTPVATIGIRGTSFVAQLTETDSSAGTDQMARQMAMLASAADNSNDYVMPTLDGTLSDADQLFAQAGAGTASSNLSLMVGVSDGSVLLSNPSGTLVLQNGEFAQVTENTEPHLLLKPVPDEEAEVDGTTEDNEETDTAGSSDSDVPTEIATRAVSTESDDGIGGDADLAVNGDSNETVSPGNEFSLRSNLAIASNITAGGFHTQALTIADGATPRDNDGNARAFVVAADRTDRIEPAIASLADGDILNPGADPVAGMHWGRWGNGVATLEFGDGTVNSLPTDQLNLHFVESASTDGRIAIPTTGSREFAIIGNTDPTDTSGNIGFLGSATLNANFDLQTVDSSLDVSINQTAWHAEGSASLGQALAPGTPDHVFSGTYSTVTVDGTSNNGAGEFSGFITEGLAGAGLSYSLSQGGDSVRGVVAFEAAN